MFRVGQKVAHVGFDGCENAETDTSIPGPRKDEVCIISAIHDNDGWPSLELIEYPAPETDVFSAGWDARAFRPIVEKSTDTGMAILREILDRESFDEKMPEHHKA